MGRNCQSSKCSCSFFNVFFLLFLLQLSIHTARLMQRVTEQYSGSTYEQSKLVLRRFFFSVLDLFHAIFVIIIDWLMVYM